MKTIYIHWLTRVFLCLAANSAFALQINQSSSTNFYVDFGSDMRAGYVAYTITNADGVAYSNLWVTIDSFTNPAVKLAGGDSGQRALGSLAPNQAKPVFFYLQATNEPGGATYTAQFTVKVYRGAAPGGTLVTSSNFVLTVNGSSASTGNNISGVSYASATNPILGSIFKMSVFGSTGNSKAGNDMSFTAATFTNWNAGAFELIGCNIVITDSPNYVLTNTLATTSRSRLTGGGDLYEADYWFRAVGSTASNTPASPANFLNIGGGSVNHASESLLLALPSVMTITNSLLLMGLSNTIALYTNQTAAFNCRFTNSSTADVIIDRVVDTLPAGFLYVSNSAIFGGINVVDPTNNGQSLVWSGSYTIPGGSSRDFVFQAIATVPTSGTNSAVAYVNNTLIDATLNPGDNAPANETVLVLTEPTAVNDVGAITENSTLLVTAPGVLGNDVEPNGFTLSVLTYSQPAHGSVTLNTDGSYIYAPATDFIGSDSFIYTVTNGNGGIATATNFLTVTAPVTNDPGRVNSISIDAGHNVSVGFAGTAGGLYDMERATNLTNPVWVVLGTTNVPPSGVWIFVDTNAPSAAAFYRARPH